MDPKFWSGGQQSFDPEGPEPKICSKYGVSLTIALARKGDPVPLWMRQWISLFCRFLSESAQDNAALRRLRVGGWIDRRENIILDIDEDFFGVEAAHARFEKVQQPPPAKFESAF